MVVEGGRRQFASGTPATRGAHNSETLEQQPDQSLVRESMPSRVTVANLVDACPGAPSRRIGDERVLRRRAGQRRYRRIVEVHFSEEGLEVGAGHEGGAVAVALGNRFG